MKKLLLILLSSFVLVSCATKKVWEEYNPAEYVKVINPSASIKDELKKTGLDYYCEEKKYSGYNSDIVCYVEKTFDEKLDELQVALYRTPEAVVIDSFNTIKVVGEVTLKLLMLVCGSNASSCAR